MRVLIRKVKEERIYRYISTDRDLYLIITEEYQSKYLCTRAIDTTSKIYNSYKIMIHKDAPLYHDMYKPIKELYEIIY